MKFLIGVFVGAGAVAVYQSDRGRAELEGWLGQSPEALIHAVLEQMRQTLGLTQTTLADATSDGAQRVAEAIDAAPLPDAVKKPASDTAFNVWSTAESLRQPVEPPSGPASNTEPTP